MKTIKIFLASSEELRPERLEMTDLINQLNKLLKCRKLEIDLEKWEYLDSAMSTTRKQDDYNEVLKTCDICLVMYWRRFGDFTGEELELAYQQMKRGEKPHKIYLFFKNLTDNNEITKDLRALKENIYTQYGHFICKFQHVDTMKLEFLLQLENYQKNILGESTLEVRNEHVYVDNTPVVNLNNIPFAANNEGFKKLQKELQFINENIQKQESRLERKKEKLNTIKIKLENHPDDDDYLEDYNELKEDINEIDTELQSSYHRRTLLEQEFEQEQKILFNTARRIIEQRGNNISNRTKRAIEAFENGYANKADIILNEAEHDAEQILTDIRLTKKIGLQSIEELMIKASIKMSNNTILIDERIKQTHQIYNQAITLAKEVGYDSNKYCDLIEKFGDFLFEYGKYEEALYYRKEHMELKEKLLSKNHVGLATSYIKYGQTLDYLDQSKEALNILKQALEICLKNYGEYHQLTAEAYNHLGNALHDDNDSIKIHEKALNIRIKVLGENHPDTARSYNNLAGKKNNIEALDYHQKALSIKLANLGKFHRYTGISFLNIARTQVKLEDYSNALNNYIAANEIFEQVSGKNHPITMCVYNDIGDLYFNLKEYSQAAEWYTKAAEKGYDAAECNLGYMYNEQQDYKKAIEWYTKAAKKGFAAAEHNLGCMYKNGEGILQDYNKAIEWYTKAAEKGFAAAECSLGYMYNEGKGVQQDYNKAIEWYTKAAEKGSVTAEYNLGLMYEDGEGVLQDYKKAIEWYTKAAEKGYAEAECNLGLMYNEGKGVQQDYKKAIELYTKAAKKGNSAAETNLGCIYEFGKGVQQDYKKAIEWYTKAAEKGNIDAEFNLGCMYKSGKGVQQDYNKAVEWYTKAAEKGDSAAESNLGYIYEFGKGVQQDYKKAIEWYTKAAEKGDTIAEFNLGLMYESGKGVQQEYKKAIEWYTKAAEKGDINAYNNLAWTLHLINEHEKALPWAEKAYKELPNKSDIIDTLATIYQELNRKEEALELFELCLKLQKEQQEDEEFQNETIEKIKKLKDILR